jgi:hypothetical protein
MIPSAEAIVPQAREHAWKYFELHANQRIAVFNFFLVLSGALSAGIAATLQGSQHFALLGVGLGVLLALVAFVFWKLDQRVSFLVKHAESALVQIEGAFPDPSLQLFHREPSLTAAAKEASGLWGRLWTYGQVFRLLFWAMALFGVAGAVLCWLRFTSYLAW